MANILKKSFGYAHKKKSKKGKSITQYSKGGIFTAKDNDAWWLIGTKYKVKKKKK